MLVGSINPTRPPTTGFLVVVTSTLPVAKDFLTWLSKVPINPPTWLLFSLPSDATALEVTFTLPVAYDFSRLELDPTLPAKPPTSICFEASASIFALEYKLEKVLPSTLPTKPPVKLCP